MHKSVNKVQQFKKVTEDMVKLYETKNHNYGNSFGDTYAELGLISAVTRMSDKMNRLKQMAIGTTRASDERIEDTLIDLANYAVMTYMEYTQVSCEPEVPKEPIEEKEEDTEAYIESIYKALDNEKVAQAIRQSEDRKLLELLYKSTDMTHYLTITETVYGENSDVVQAHKELEGMFWALTKLAFTIETYPFTEEESFIAMLMYMEQTTLARLQVEICKKTIEKEEMGE